MGVEMTGASSCSSHRILGDTSPRAEGRRNNGAGSGLIRDLPAARSGGGWGEVRTRWGAPGGVPPGPRRAPRAGPAPAALSRGLDEPSQLRDRAPRTPARAGHLYYNFRCSSPPMPGTETKKLGLCSPQNKGSPPRPRPGSPPPPRILPSPSFGDLKANKAAALGAWRSPACGRPLSAQ